MEDKTRYVLYVVISGFVLGGLGTIFGNALRSNSGSRVHIATFFLICICVFLVLFSYERAKTPREIELVFLKRVRDAWVSDLVNFEKGLPQCALFTVNFSFKPETVNGPARLGRLPETPDDESPAILRAFENSGRSLLITGAAGSGKTVSLLQLARALVSQAEENPAAPLPVVLSLATWVNLATWEEETFERWLVKELRQRYDVEEDIARSWILGKRLLFLFDDFSHNECTKDRLGLLNNFLQTVGNQGTAIVAQDDPQGTKLKLSTAIRLKKLSAGYVQRMLRGLGKGVAADRLIEVARSPLMLRIISVTPAEVLAKTKKEEKQILDAYVKHQLGSAGDMKPPYTSARLKTWLGWLAVQSQELSQPVFAIEELQPSWLGTANKQRGAYVFISRILGAFIVMLLGVLIMFLAEMMGKLVGSYSYNFNFIEVRKGLGWWFVITVIGGGSTIGLLEYFRLIKGTDNSWREWLAGKLRRHLLLSNLLVCFGVFLLPALALGFQLKNSLHAATAFAVAFALTYWNRDRDRSIATDITTGHRLVWAGSDIPKGLHWGFVCGYLGGMAYLTFKLVEQPPAGVFREYLIHIFSLMAFLVGLIFWRPKPKHSRDSHAPTAFVNSAFECGLSLAALYGVVAAFNVWTWVGLTLGHKVLGLSCFLGALIGLVVRGLKKVSIVESRTPYQGLKTSLRTTILLWLSVGVPAVALIWGYSALGLVVEGTFKEALFFGMMLGLLFGFSYGGLDLVYRLVLRGILWKNGSVPVLEYAAALDDAANLGLLRKVGHAYVFYHDSIRDYLKKHGTSK